jgi:hypothetical protein
MGGGAEFLRSWDEQGLISGDPPAARGRYQPRKSSASVGLGLVAEPPHPHPPEIYHKEGPELDDTRSSAGIHRCFVLPAEDQG